MLNELIKKQNYIMIMLYKAFQEWGYYEMSSLQDKFFQDAMKHHADTYDYSFVDIVDLDKEVKIICRLHGDFMQTPRYHMKGCGCQKCGNLKATRPEGTEGLIKIFLDKAKQVHGDRYDYSNMTYNNCRTGINIICTFHGDFIQKPITHLKGSGCPECGKIRSSQLTPPKEGELILQIPLRNKNKDIVDYAIVDADEYNNVKGLAWHRYESNSNYYAFSQKNGVPIKLHHLILKRSEETDIVDHIDGDVSIDTV